MRRNTQFISKFFSFVGDFEKMQYVGSTAIVVELGVCVLRISALAPKGQRR